MTLTAVLAFFFSAASSFTAGWKRIFVLGQISPRFNMLPIRSVLPARFEPGIVTGYYRSCDIHLLISFNFLNFKLFFHQIV